MFLIGYRCNDCKRILRRDERAVTEGPLGPETLCPHCEGLVTLQANRLLIVLFAIFVGVAAIGYGCWASRMPGLLQKPEGVSGPSFYAVLIVFTMRSFLRVFGVTLAAPPALLI